MYKIPNIPTFPQLKGIDLKIQSLQTILSDNLSWLQYSFGICERMKKTVNDEEITIPAGFAANRSDYIDLRPFPDDSWNSYSFWDMEDPADVKYDNTEAQYSKRQFAHYLYNISCIFVIDVNKIDTNYTFKENKSRMREDIADCFETNLIDFDSHFWINQIFERDIEEIFKGFTIEQPERIMKYPLIAFRFECFLLFKRACPVNNIYS